jgi:hypothetical protein
MLCPYEDTLGILKVEKKDLISFKEISQGIFKIIFQEIDLILYIYIIIRNTKS